MGDPRHACKCAPQQVERYMGRISGPLLDRIDLHLEIPSVPFEELSSTSDGTDSATMREQVSKVRAAQADRFGPDDSTLNGRMNSRQLRRHCGLDPRAEPCSARR